MNVVKTIDQFDINYVYFLDPIKNNVMSEGSFIRIIYSNSVFILNGVYLLINIDNIAIEKNYNKLKCIFNTIEYADIIRRIKEIEENILNKISLPKIKKYKIYDQLNSGCIRIFSEDFYKNDKERIYVLQNKSLKNSLMLKISGIWETDTEYGLTYKFIKI